MVARVWRVRHMLQAQLLVLTWAQKELAAALLNCKLMDFYNKKIKNDPIPLESHTIHLFEKLTPEKKF